MQSIFSQVNKFNVRTIILTFFCHPFALFQSSFLAKFMSESFEILKTKLNIVCVKALTEAKENRAMESSKGATRRGAKGLKPLT